MRLHRRFDQSDAEYWIENELFDEILEDYHKLLHNYVASIFTVVRHTQRIVNKFGGDDFYDQYTGELLERGLDKKSGFLQQLRHYTQKRKVPPLEVDMEFAGGDEIEVQLRIRREMMLDWDGWNSTGKEFMENMEDDRPISDIYKEFQRESERFYNWFFDYARRYFKDELEKTLEMIFLIETIKDSLRDPREKTELEPTLFGFRERTKIEMPTIPPELTHPYDPENILWDT